ncbi:hypothetical protein [Peptoniphilus phoceensis]|uniref:hypothetical protein n=1 Tax=Peptoniphilus phoceensis TaxID=1720298 RepID=UPI000782FFA0|nr:hypothetical protein [Peptoniphilus phoceensis]
MNSIYKNPYKKKYKLEIIDKINRDGITYGKVENQPFFLGSERVDKDEIKINGEDPIFLSGNKNYFKIDEESKSVEIEIAWKNRLLLMQENLGNALVRHFLLANTNIEILNYKVQKNSSYIDVSAKDFKFMTAKNIESLANYAVFSNLIIENFEDHISIERLADIPYEGPALTRTGEIGMILISSVEKLNSMLRLTITSGENAYKLARNSLNTLDNMKMYLNSDSIDSVFSDLKKLRSNLNSSRNLGKSHEEVKVLEKSFKEDKINNSTKLSESFDDKNSNKKSSEENKNSLNNLEKENVPENKNKELKKEIKEDKYDSKIFHEKYKLESFKNLNKKIKAQKEKNNSKNYAKKEENYDSQYFHKKYKLESFKDLNKMMDSKKEQEKLDDNRSMGENKKSTNSLDNDKTHKEEEKSPIFYQVVESFKAFSTEVSGLNYIYKVLEDVNLNELREVSNYILKDRDFIQIYGIKNGNNSKILILRSQNLNFDLKKIFVKLKEHFSYSGTGNMYTLDINCQEKDLKRIMESFLIEIKREAK